MRSFKDLTADEARRLIDVLKVSIGQALTRQPRAWTRIRERAAARTAGTAGRKGARSKVAQLVGPDDLARIDEAITRLQWTREQYEAWLQSASSPLGQHNGSKIRTVADANRVWWALKSMLVRSGHWHSARKANVSGIVDK